MKPCADLQQTGHAAPNNGAAIGGFGDSGEDLEKGGFAGTVTANDPQDFAGLDLETDILESPELVATRRVVIRHWLLVIGCIPRQLITVNG